MQIAGTTKTVVTIEPKEVIAKMKVEAIGIGHVFEKEGSFFLGYDYEAGPHRIKQVECITKETYEYVRALETIERYL